MEENKLPERKHPRLKEFDYSRDGAYFLTICTQGRKRILSKIEGKKKEDIVKEQRKQWEDLSVQEHMDHYLSQGIQKKEAMKLVAKDRGVSKRDIYQSLL